VFPKRTYSIVLTILVSVTDILFFSKRRNFSYIYTTLIHYWRLSHSRVYSGTVEAYAARHNGGAGNGNMQTQYISKNGQLQRTPRLCAHIDWVWFAWIIHHDRQNVKIFYGKYKYISGFYTLIWIQWDAWNYSWVGNVKQKKSRRRDLLWFEVYDSNVFQSQTVPRSPIEPHRGPTLGRTVFFWATKSDSSLFYLSSTNYSFKTKSLQWTIMFQVRKVNVISLPKKNSVWCICCLVQLLSLLYPNLLTLKLITYTRDLEC
jgi:hypothetical protein